MMLNNTQVLIILLTGAILSVWLGVRAGMAATVVPTPSTTEMVPSDDWIKQRALDRKLRTIYARCHKLETDADYNCHSADACRQAEIEVTKCWTEYDHIQRGDKL